MTASIAVPSVATAITAKQFFSHAIWSIND
jgi:hypothetical protein